jgi:hypothetical protein
MLLHRCQERVAELEADGARLDWIIDHATYVGGGHGGIYSFGVTLDHEHGMMRAAIDEIESVERSAVMTVLPTRICAGCGHTDMPMAAATDWTADDTGFDRVSRRPSSRAMPPVPSVMVIPAEVLAVEVSTKRPAVPPSLTMEAVTPLGVLPVLVLLIFP